MRNRNNQNWQKLLKDYAVPLVGIALIILLVGSYFFGGSTTDQTLEKENQIGLSITLDNPETEAYITYSGTQEKKKIEAPTSLYKGEKIDVKSGNVTLIAAQIGEFRLGRGGELKFSEDGSLQFYSSDFWIKNTAPLTVNMKYAKVNIGEKSVLNLTQNEANSTVYNLNGFVEVSNIAGKNTVLGKGQKVTISSMDATKTDLDVTLLKEDLDDYFKMSDWFLKNNGATYLIDASTTASGATATGATASGSTNTDLGLKFTNFADEQTFTQDTINISGSVGNPKVAFVAITGTQKIPVRETDQGFEIKGVKLTQKVNDLVLKTYDGSGNLVEKYGYTVYSNSATTQSPTNAPKELFEVKNFSLDASKFKFIAPGENPFTTTNTILTIEGTVPASTVDKIDVNGFVLTKFPSGGTYWKYHVNADYGNLKEGLNIYEVKYLAKDGSVLHKNAFTIIKKSPEKVVSDEATPTNPPSTSGSDL